MIVVILQLVTIKSCLWHEIYIGLSMNLFLRPVQNWCYILVYLSLCVYSRGPEFYVTVDLM